MDLRLLKVLACLIIESDFKSAKKKFLDQGVDDDTVKKYIEDFKDLKKKNRIKKPKEKDIDTWGREDFKKFKSFVDTLKKFKSKTQEKKFKKAEGAELVGENNKWSVYKITTHKASCFYGSGTKWCTTEKDSTHFDHAIERDDLYYLLSKYRKKDDLNYKIAMVVHDNRITPTYYDAKNTVIDLPKEIEKELPEVVGVAYTSGINAEDFANKADQKVKQVSDYFSVEYDQTIGLYFVVESFSEERDKYNFDLDQTKKQLARIQYQSLVFDRIIFERLVGNKLTFMVPFSIKDFSIRKIISDVKKAHKVLKGYEQYGPAK